MLIACPRISYIFSHALLTLTGIKCLPRGIRQIFAELRMIVVCIVTSCHCPVLELERVNFPVYTNHVMITQVQQNDTGFGYSLRIRCKAKSINDSLCFVGLVAH